MITPLHVALFSAVLAVLTFLYNVFFAPSRAERKEVEKRLAKLELDNASHETRFIGVNQAMERQSDHFEEKCRKIESELSGVGRMREDLAVMKAKQDAQFESINEIKSTMKEIFNLLRVSKN